MEDTVNNKLECFSLFLNMRSAVDNMATSVRDIALFKEPEQEKKEWQKVLSLWAE